MAKSTDAPKKRTKSAKATVAAPEPSAPPAPAESRPARRKTAKTAPGAGEKAPKAPPPPPATVATDFGPITLNRRGNYDFREAPCLCGCGSPTQTPKAKFVSGHDSTMRKVILEAVAAKGGKLKAADLSIPDLTLALMTREPVAGLSISRNGYILDVKKTGDEAEEESGDEEDAE